jgi:formylmethanofuran dehydrogenase subunit E
MMVITSKLYLEAIHEVTKKAIEEQKKVNSGKVEHMDEIHLNMQKRVLKELEDWDRDDCMIDGYDDSAFSPYKHLVPSNTWDVIKEKIAQCDDCGDFYPKEKMNFVDSKYVCKGCSAKKGESVKIEEGVK